jgi:uncharacterized protein with gpF-like domain
MASYRLAAPVFPNSGLAAAYQGKPAEQLARTRDAIEPVILEAWETLAELQPVITQGRPPLLHGLPHPQHTPDLAFDVSYAEMMADYERRLIEALSKRNRDAESLAAWFSDSAAAHASSALKHNLSTALSFEVRLHMTPALRAAISSRTRKNVELITNIHTLYTDQLAEAVLDSVTRGRDLPALQKVLTERFGVAESRSRLIARDQNNKATSAIDRQRKEDLGLKQSRWMRVNVSKVPRPGHVAANGQLFDNASGCLIEGKYVFPGEEILCHCVSQTVIPGYFYDAQAALRAWNSQGASA